MENIKSTYESVKSSTIGIIVTSCIILYIIARFIIYFLQYSLTTGLSNGVTIIPGKLSGSQTYNNKQTPTGDAIVGLSTNEINGVEFTYSLWLKINSDNIGSEHDIATCDFDSSCGKNLIHIFNKGDDTGETSSTDLVQNVSKINNAPGVYLRKNNTEIVLLIYMDTMGTEPSYTKKPITVSNLPIMKWFSLIIIAKSNVLYIYVNGRLKSSYIFKDEVFKQNYDDITINKHGIEWGSLADLVYYPRALNGLEIQSLLLAGPDQKQYIKTDSIFNETPSYLNTNWYNM